jgi:hypothetical protein
VKPITQDRFKSDSKVNSLHLSALSIEEPKPKGDSNPKDFYINIDRRLIKIEIASVNIVEARRLHPYKNGR